MRVPLALARLALAGVFFAPMALQASSGSPAFIALQPLAKTHSARLADGAQLQLVDLNPTIGRWLILRELSPAGAVREAHLDAGQEGSGAVSLTSRGIVVSRRMAGSDKRVDCPLDSESAREALFKTRAEPFYLVCSNALFVRGRSKGYKSSLESVTDWLRDQGPMGETLINWQKDLFPTRGDPALAGDGAARGAQDGPAPALLSAAAPSSVQAGNLGVAIAERASAFPTGGWVRASKAPGVWLSVAAPAHARALPSSPSSSQSLAYFMALDTSQMDLRYSLGSEHPSLGWSSRPPGPRQGPGPDGISSSAPLQRAGIAPPWAQARLSAVFTGGFKREHSAFKGGPFATQRNGTHYGLVEAGVVFSRLHPGLATLYQRVGEAPTLKLWTEEDNQKGLSGLIFARQNGLPLVEAGKEGGQLGISWGGNWSGNFEGNAETLRSAVCVATRGERRYVIYGVFSKAVPRDMAQLLKAYGCEGAMQLDMNAPALVYAAVTVSDGKGGLTHQPLLKSMTESGAPAARFAASADTRDFFYAARR